MSELPDLNQLEFENSEVSRGEKREVISSKNYTNEDKVLIDYSSRIVATLQTLMKTHNKERENKVSLKELKEVFRRGANCSEAKEVEIPCGVLALARVNMFLRLKSGEIMEASSSEVKSFDISDSWHPNESDFIKATELTIEDGLDYEFKNISNLYLEEYTKIELEY
jgi:hypothetical protein